MVKQNGKILVVDDNEEILLSLELLLGKTFSHITTIKSPSQLDSLLKREQFDVYILDMNFSAEVKSGNEGFYWMNRILETDGDASVIFITAFAGIELAVRAIKEGAVDFIEKPWDNRKLLVTVQNALTLRQAKPVVKLLKNRQTELTGKADGPEWIRGGSPIMNKVYDTVERVADSDANVLIMGENGSGKEHIAREIHRLSTRRNDAFVHVDMGALPETLFESELFGHVKGAFTDAKEDRAGRFELASGGTLFLDEIGNLPSALQPKILHAIQDKKVTRLGSGYPDEIDVRLICATNQPLYKMVEEGSFREDLLYRINTIQIDVPPLRERRSDLPLLVEFFLEKFSRKYHKTGLKLSGETMNKITRFDWPGNIRQLQNAIENAVVLSDGNTLKLADFILTKAPSPGRKPVTSNFYDNEKSHVSEVLNKTSWNLSKAARELGISRSTLYRKINKYGL